MEPLDARSRGVDATRSDAHPGDPQIADSRPVDSRPFDPGAARHLAQGAETARHIATQIARHLPDRDSPGFDIRLDPEELGHVRLKLVTHDTGSVLIVHADRPETLELMRRNIAMLEQDLRTLGHESLTLRFGNDGAGQGGTHPQTPPRSDSGFSGQPTGISPDTTSHPHATRPRAASRDHLDLRL